MSQVYDVVISGGGMVGASLACALSQLPLRVAVVEAVAFSEQVQPAYDDRSIALSLGSQRIFHSLGLWQDLAAAATPIKTIHVSDRGHFGVTRLSHVQEKVPALGYVVISRSFGAVLGRRLQELDNVDFICPAKVTGLNQGETGVNVQISRDGQNSTLQTRLLVAADGGQSQIRQLLDISTEQSDYNQTAIIANVSISAEHQNTAYERFTDSGPLALLPLPGRQCALVWTVWRDQVEHLLDLDDEAFLQALQQRFGHRLGSFVRIGRRTTYPLHLLRAKESVNGRVVVIGNAAHSLHPIAGQGFNLGLRDVAVLVEHIAKGLRLEKDPGCAAVLEGYREQQSKDHERVVRFTDGLVRLFSNQLPPLALARNGGMLAFELLPAAKHYLSRNAMGLSGRVSGLARGIPVSQL